VTGGKPPAGAAEPRIADRRPGILGPFRFKDFRLLWSGLLVSNLGTWMQFTALGYYVASLATNGREGALGIGLIGAARAVPVLVLSPFAGVVADRYPRRRILLIISGGIAAYKALDLIRRLRERGARVRCILTAGAQQFITPLTLQTLSRNAVLTSVFDDAPGWKPGHVDLADRANLLLVAPATASSPRPPMPWSRCPRCSTIGLGPGGCRWRSWAQPRSTGLAT